MNRRRQAWWAKRRNKGRAYHIWVRGVVGFGLSLTICFWVYLAIQWPQHPYFSVNLAFAAIICLIGGYLFGICSWNKLEKEFRQSNVLHHPVKSPGGEGADI
jgi:hypothetical protein